MANYSHERIVPFKDSGLGKKQQIAEMFDKIAFRYDFLNRFLSGGIDIYWRRRAIRELRGLAAGAGGPAGATGAGMADPASAGAGAGGPAGATGAAGAAAAGAGAAGSLAVLDVATGTGDMAIMLTRYLAGVHVTGIDISRGMLEIGEQKIGKLGLASRINLQLGDSEALQFADGSFDGITVAFGVRNFENLEKGLREMFRVLRPGGRLVVLEFSRPHTPGICQIYDLYLRLVAPNVGKMVSSSREAYQYLNDSVKAFPEGNAFLDILNNCGYTQRRLRRLSLGICTLYIGEKQA
jgi:demethylmenaquinone methyltransferase/2-methoxy-6-polyprenyl-1,4-benzoquinol methylase